MSEEFQSVLEGASQEIEALRRDARLLRRELTELQRTNSRLSNLLFSQRQAIHNLLERITPGTHPLNGEENPVFKKAA